MPPQPKAVAIPNRDPVTALSFHAAALADLARIARAGLSPQATVDRFLDLHPSIRLTTGNLDATCHALGIARTQATRGGKVPNPHTRHPPETGLRRATIHKKEEQGKPVNLPTA